ncbi:hypothetical protein NLM16_05565 [Bradyrhizobium brasilense]|uniref:hypothetical protein n=1 Tax=Bradyrhizobium brasilense TaxID=1419277 RepID=UPI00287731F7|nr:hypothetical protein [Bradyrhizobium brasilense]MCP3413564.1 hypothetical protein [Bradyrhizobium brasilense]
MVQDCIANDASADPTIIDGERCDRAQQPRQERLFPDEVRHILNGSHLATVTVAVRFESRYRARSLAIEDFCYTKAWASNLVRLGAIDEVIADITHNPASTEDLERVKSRLIEQIIQTRWSRYCLRVGMAAVSRQDCASMIFEAGRKIADSWNWRGYYITSGIRAVSAEQGQEAARKWLDKNRSGERLPH